MKTRFAIPLIIFGALVALFYFTLTQIGKGEYNPRDIPSPLVGKPAPAFALVSVADPGRPFDNGIFAEHPVSLFNVWASWCTACRQEHPFLMELAQSGAVPIYGLNYKDKRADALNWLSRFGDPYLASGFDLDGTTGIDWGVYGVPETFLVDRAGQVRYKHIGPLDRRTWDEKIKPMVAAIRAEGA